LIKFYGTFKSILIFCGAVTIFFFLYPIILILLFGVKDINSALTTGSFLASVQVTFIIATGAAILSVLVGTPFAYLLARSDFKFKEVIDAIIDIPLMVPHVLVGIMIVLAFSSQYGLGPFLQRIGINMIDTLIGAIVTVTYLSATYSIRVTESAIKMINPDVELTARTLGSTPSFTFTHVIMPRIWKAIANGAILTWARAVAEVGALLVVAYYVYFNGNYVYPASIYIYVGYEGLGLAGIANYSAALLLIVLATFIIYRFVLRHI
jgi:molybdate/tungstate transport system permease protein